jgi:hypothetical protein
LSLRAVPRYSDRKWTTSAVSQQSKTETQGRSRFSQPSRAFSARQTRKPKPSSNAMRKMRLRSEDWSFSRAGRVLTSLRSRSNRITLLRIPRSTQGDINPFCFHHYRRGGSRVDSESGGREGFNRRPRSCWRWVPGHCRGRDGAVDRRGRSRWFQPGSCDHSRHFRGYRRLADSRTSPPRIVPRESRG